METLASVGVTGAIEVAPAGTLVGLIKRAVPAIEQSALKSPAELENAQTFAATHGGK
jgi:[acyl-carrier-protein] S-malonyltransferase